MWRHLIYIKCVYMNACTLAFTCRADCCGLKEPFTARTTSKTKLTLSSFVHITHLSDSLEAHHEASQNGPGPGIMIHHPEKCEMMHYECVRSKYRGDSAVAALIPCLNEPPHTHTAIALSDRQSGRSHQAIGAKPQSNMDEQQGASQKVY